MRGGLSKTLALVGAAGLLAVSACGNSDDSGGGGDSSANKDVTVFTWWADGGEKAGLDGLVLGVRHRLQGLQVRQRRGRRWRRVERQAGAGQRPAGGQAAVHVPGARRCGAEGLHQRRPGRGRQPAVQGLRAGQGLPAEPDRQPDRRRQDLLGPGQHPPGERGLGQHDGAEEANIDGATAPANVDAWIADLDKLKAKGVKAPLAICKGWAQEMLVEAVLIADLGPDKFTGSVERQDRLGRRRRDRRAEQVQDAADLHQRRPRGDRLAGRAGVREQGPGRLHADG